MQATYAECSHPTLCIRKGYSVATNLIQGIMISALKTCIPMCSQTTAICAVGPL